MNKTIRKQMGLVLTELVIALTLVTILIGATVSLYDTNRSRAEALYEKMSAVAGGLLRMKTDAACFPSKLAGMVNPTDARDTFCGIKGSENWNGPYTDIGTRFGTDSVNDRDIVLEQIAPELSVFLEERVLMANTSSAGQPINEKKAWVLSTRGLTSELQTHFLDYCSELPVGSGVGSITKSRCFKQADGQVGFLVNANDGWEQYYDALINPPVVAESCKGASCNIIRNANPNTITVDPCAANPAACAVVEKCPDGTPIPASGSCAPPPPKTDYCPDGNVKPASGICPATPTYCPDGITVMPASGICPTVKLLCRVGIDAACTRTSSSGGFGGSSSSSSSSSGGVPGYRGSDGQLYNSPDAVPGKDEPCGDCNREVTSTYEKDAAMAAGKEMNEASSIGGSIANALSSIASSIAGAFSAIGSFLSSFFSSPEGGGSSSGGGNTSSNSGQHADGSGGESGNNTSTTGHAGGCGSSGC